MTSWHDCTIGCLREFGLELQNEPDAACMVIYALMVMFSISAELYWGCWLSSMSFLSDMMHYIFDAFSVFMCIAAIMITRTSKYTYSNGSKGRSFIFSYGYERLEVVAAFINSIMMLFAWLLLVADALQHALGSSSNECEDETPLTVDILSSGVPLLGLTLLWYRMQDRGEHDLTRLMNLDGVKIHMLSDACESLGSLVFTKLVPQQGWHWVQIGICMSIGWIIIMSAIPLLIQSGMVLLQTTPLSLQVPLAKRVQEVLSFENVLGHNSVHFWTISPGTVIGSISVLVHADCDASVVKSNVREAFYGLAKHMTIQVEKTPLEHDLQCEEQLLHLQPLCDSSVPLVHPHSHSHFTQLRSCNTV